MGNILVKTAPLILTGLAFAFTYKANLFNIGIQRPVLCGLYYRSRNFLETIWILTKLSGDHSCGSWKHCKRCFRWVLIGFFKARFGANEFLISMMSTYVFTYLNLLLMRTVLQESNHNYIKTDYLEKPVWLPQLIPGTSVSWGIVLAVLVAFLIWFILYKTSLSYRIRITGINKEAAGMAGINPQKAVYDCVCYFRRHSRVCRFDRGEWNAAYDAARL